MTPPQTTIRIRNYDRVNEIWNAETVRANLEGPIRRTIGTSGDAIVMTVQIADWPNGFDDHGDFEFYINSAQAGNDLTLSGYLLKNKLPMAMGNATDDPDGDPAPQQYRLLFENRLRAHRDGYGGLIRESTYNELDENGFVDTDADNYKTIQELVEMALESMDIDYEPAPVELNTGVDGTALDAPGPMDWGNARPVSELESLLGRIGWTLVQLNDGTIAVRRLRRAGQPITIPAEIENLAEPYELTSSPASRANKIVITSGSTRRITITKLDLSAFDWVVFDTSTNQWVDQDANALTLYKEGLKPSNADPEGGRQLAQLYRALRLKGIPEVHLAEKSRFINIPTTHDAGDFAPFAGSAGFVEALCCTKIAADQLKNTPQSGPDLARVDGLRAIAGSGVFVLPSSAEFVRVDGHDTGRRSDVRELNDDELEITFAHESNTGDYFEDYYAICFEWTESKGAITVDSTDFETLEAAMDDPSVVKVAAPFLRSVQTHIAGTEITLPLNFDELKEVAKQFAVAYLSNGSVQAGVIELRGIVDINPGDIDGSVTSVLWDVYQNRTVITINQHEVPRSKFELLQLMAGRSITAGIGSLQLNRSSAAKADIRTNFVAEDRASGNIDTTPEGSASSRGRERAMSGVTGAVDAGPRPRAELMNVSEMSTIFAMITASTADGSNKWLYDWSEVRFENGTAVTTGAQRTSATHGKAINTLELMNSSSGVQGNGIDVANLTGTFALQPIPDNKAIVQLQGPMLIGGQNRWLFSAPNGVDGACP